MTATFIVGDTREVTASMPDASVDLILCSPPFLALRSYLPADHESKHLEIGSEANPAAFIDVLLELSAEWRRILAPHGSIVIELGDTYSGSGGAGGDYNDGGLRDGQARFRQSGWHRAGARADGIDGLDGSRFTYRKGSEAASSLNGGNGWPLAKSLALVPELYRIALAYGINPLTGQPSPAGRWRVRNVVRWVRPNPPVGALGDKFRPATSDLVVACVAGDRWFDLDAVRTPMKEHSLNYWDAGSRAKKGGSPEVGRREEQLRSGAMGKGRDGSIPPKAGAPPLDWWQIATDAPKAAAVLRKLKARKVNGHPYPEERDALDQAIALLEAASDPSAPNDWWQIVPGGYSGAHYAVWPPALCERPIEAMCPRRVCRECGKPSRRDVEKVADYATYMETKAGRTLDPVRARRNHEGNAAMSTMPAEYTTVGWSSCGCPNSDGLQLDGYHTGTGWRPGLVYDPFAGSGTTLVVAHGHSRDSIGADLDPRNAELAAQRLGMFLQIQTQQKEETHGIA